MLFRQTTDFKFATWFFVSFFILILTIYLFVSAADAYKIFNKPWSLNCAFTKSETLTQFHLIKQFPGAQALVVGSSTSQNYEIPDIREIFALDTYHASAGGATALAKYVFVTTALQNFSELKKIFFIADFFEFNANGDRIVPTSIYHQPLLQEGAALSNLDISAPSISDVLLDIFSYQAFETAATHIKKCLNNRDYGYFNADGSSTLDILVNAISKADLEKLPSDELSKMLDLKVAENFVIYERGFMRDYDELSSDVKTIYQKVISESRARGVELHLVLSPYHPLFRKKLLSIPLLQQRYSEWKTFLIGLQDKKNGIYIYDFNQDEPIFPENARYWRDGTHYGRRGSFIILQRIRNISQSF